MERRLDENDDGIMIEEANGKVQISHDQDEVKQEEEEEEEESSEPAAENDDDNDNDNTDVDGEEVVKDEQTVQDEINMEKAIQLVIDR